MAQLYLHGQEIDTVFDLLGDEENDITFSMGWALARCDVFLMRLLKEVFPQQKTGKVTSINLQKHGNKHGGYTDIEIETDFAHVIIEAKRGLNPPTRTQLDKYMPRFKEGRRNAIVVMAESDPTYALSKLPKAVRSVPVRYTSWKQVTKTAKQSVGSGTHAEKRLLREFVAYMEGVMDMQNQESNWVYVIALGDNETRPWAGTSWREYVIENRIFFQDVYDKAPWPPEPPNYLGFRYDGNLRTIHHVDKYERVEDGLLRHGVPVHRRKSWMKDPHHICWLGPAIICPEGKGKATGLQHGRVWAALDLLLTRKTILKAVKDTDGRLSQ
jgi:hypothetical protein